MKRILKVVLAVASLWVAVRLIPGLEFDGEIWEWFVVALLIVVASTIIKPILNVLSLPLIVLTLGLFLLITNAVTLHIVIWLSAPGRLDLGLESSGFFWATFLGALVISLVRMVLDRTLD